MRWDFVRPYYAMGLREPRFKSSVLVNIFKLNILNYKKRTFSKKINSSVTSWTFVIAIKIKVKVLGRKNSGMTRFSCPFPIS
jgi:hypothetical protein